MYDVLNAAGAGKVFERYFRQMKEQSWVVRGMQEVEGIRDRLASLAASFWILHNLCRGHELILSVCVRVCVDERGSKALIGCLAGIE